MEAPLSEPFVTRRKKLLSRPDGSMLYGKLGKDFFSLGETLHPKMKIRFRLTGSGPKIYMINDNSNVSLGTVDSSLFTHRIARNDDYHNKRLHMLAYTPVESNSMETLAKTFIIATGQKQFIRESIFDNAPFRQIAIAMNTRSAVTGSYTWIPFRYQQSDFRQIRLLRGGQPIVDFDVSDKCR